MNDKRRRAIKKIAAQLEELEMMLDDLRGEEEEALEALPDSFRDGEKGEKMQAAIDNLEEVMSDLAYSRDKLEEVTA